MRLKKLKIWENISSGKHSIQTSKEYTVMQEVSYLFQFVWLGKWGEKPDILLGFPELIYPMLLLYYCLKLNSKITFVVTDKENWTPAINQEGV